jgi:hypothetical protein
MSTIRYEPFVNGTDKEEIGILGQFQPCSMRYLWFLQLALLSQPTIVKVVEVLVSSGLCLQIASVRAGRIALR